MHAMCACYSDIVSNTAVWYGLIVHSRSYTLKTIILPTHNSYMHHDLSLWLTRNSISACHSQTSWLVKQWGQVYKIKSHPLSQLFMQIRPQATVIFGCSSTTTTIHLSSLLQYDSYTSWVVEMSTPCPILWFLALVCWEWGSLAVREWTAWEGSREDRILLCLVLLEDGYPSSESITVNKIKSRVCSYNRY